MLVHTQYVQQHISSTYTPLNSSAAGTLLSSGANATPDKSPAKLPMPHDCRARLPSTLSLCSKEHPRGASQHHPTPGTLIGMRMRTLVGTHKGKKRMNPVELGDKCIRHYDAIQTPKPPQASAFLVSGAIASWLPKKPKAPAESSSQCTSPPSACPDPATVPGTARRGPKRRVGSK